jgi:hypothetical protein
MTVYTGSGSAALFVWAACLSYTQHTASSYKLVIADCKKLPSTLVSLFIAGLFAEYGNKISQFFLFYLGYRATQGATINK